jgi:hypothetical protein
METVIMDEKCGTTDPVEPMPGRARRRLHLAVVVGALAVVVGVLVFEIVATVFAVEFTLAMARLVDPSGRTDGHLVEVLWAVVGVLVPGSALVTWVAVRILDRAVQR